MAKKRAKGISLEITNPPLGMNPSQFFENQSHFEDWMKENKSKFPNLKITKDKMTFGEKGVGKITEK